MATLISQIEDIERNVPMWPASVHVTILRDDCDLFLVCSFNWFLCCVESHQY